MSPTSLTRPWLLLRFLAVILAALTLMAAAATDASAAPAAQTEVPDAPPPGYGDVMLRAEVTNYIEFMLPADTPYGFTADYTLPDGQTASAFASWTPPGTLNSTGTGGTVTVSLTVRQDQREVLVGRFPAGTTLTLHGDMTPAAPFTPAGVTWDKPWFRAGFRFDEIDQVAVQDQSTTNLIMNANPVFTDPSTGIFLVTKLINKPRINDEVPMSWTPGAPDGTSGVLAADSLTGTGAVGTGRTLPLVEDDAGDPAPDDDFADLFPYTRPPYVNDDAEPFVSKVFTFTYTCDDPAASHGTLHITGHGVATSPVLPEGTTCTVTEDVESAQIPGYTLDAAWPRPVTIWNTLPGFPHAYPHPPTAEMSNWYTPDPGSTSCDDASASASGTLSQSPAPTAVPAAPALADAGLLAVRRRV